MENKEINVTEETMNTVEEVAKNTSKKGLWIAAGVAIAGGVAYVVSRVVKKAKAKKAKKEEGEATDWTEDLDTTVQQIKNEDID